MIVCISYSLNFIILITSFTFYYYNHIIFLYLLSPNLPTYFTDSFSNSCPLHKLIIVKCVYVYTYTWIMLLVCISSVLTLWYQINNWYALSYGNLFLPLSNFWAPSSYLCRVQGLWALPAPIHVNMSILVHVQLICRQMCWIYLYGYIFRHY